ncbi:MAG: NAD-dependent epimerase/dehydratase family protein [Rhodospirillales bacterium]
MTSCLVIGAGGFIGVNMVAYLKNAGFIVHEAFRGTSREELARNTYDLVFNCAGNSKTWLSQRDPLKCLQENVIDLVSDLKDLRFGVWVQISSNTVYTTENTQEDVTIVTEEIGTYAFHKLLGEHYTQHLASKWLVLRPTGFFGPGLKKNLLFDLRHNATQIFYTRDSFIDFLPIEIFCEMAKILAERTVHEVVNVGSGIAVSVEKIIKPFSHTTISENARYVDNRKLNLAKLKQYYPKMPSNDKIESQVRAFLVGT